MKQQFNGPVQHVAGRDLVVIQVLDPLTREECEMVLAYRAAPDEVRQRMRMAALARADGSHDRQTPRHCATYGISTTA